MHLLKGCDFKYMADEQYKISLGVDLDTSDIKTQINGVKADPIKINIDLNHTKKQIDAIKSQIQSLNNVKVNLGAGAGSNSSRNGIRSTVNEMNWAYRQTLDIQKKANPLSLKINGLDTSKNVNELKELSLQFARLRSDYETLRRAFGSQLSTNQWGNLQAELDETSAKLSAMDAKIADTKTKLANGIKLKLDDGTFNNDISNIESKFNKLSGKSNELKAGIDIVKQALTDMGNAAKTGNIDKLISANERYEQALKDVNNQLQINARAEKDAAAAQKLDDSRNTFMSNIDAWLIKNSAATKKFGAQMLELKAQAKSCDGVTLNHLKSEFQKLDKEAESAGLKMQSLGDRIKTQFQKYGQYFSVASMVIWATQGLRDMFDQVVSIDTAMTELKKVTDETDVSYNQFLSDAASKSKKLGTTIDGLVSSTADFARLGYGFQESQGLAEVANIYAVVGDEIEGVEGATKSLISTLAAFKDEASGISDTDFAMEIVDKFNEVSNNFAILSGGIGEAMQRSASSLRAANNTIDESIALITAANEVVQDPAVIGIAFKTISMRIRGAKSELEEAGLETDGMVESTAKLREEIMALSGVDIMENENTFKSTYAIMDELAAKWQDLSDIQQATITELIAGKRQGNVISSLMQNFQTARDALETSLNSSGSAMAEHAKWSQSLEARLNKLKSTWQSLSQSFLSSDFLKTALDWVIGLVNGLDKLIDTFGALPTLFAAFAAFKSFTGKGIFKVVEDEASLSGKRIQSIFNQALSGIGKDATFSFSTGFEAALADDVAALQNYITKLQSGVPAEEAFAQTMRQASAEAQQFAKTMNTATVSTSQYETVARQNQVSMVAMNKSFKSTKSLINEYNSGFKTCKLTQEQFVGAVGKTNTGLSKYLSGLNGAKASMGGYISSLVGAKVATFALEAASMAMNAALTMGISLIISGIVSAISKWINAEEELAEKVEEVTSKFKEQHNELARFKGDYDTSNEDSMISKYEKLSKGVDNLGRNVSLTSDEYSEYQSIVNKIADQIPSLISGYDAQGNAILSCKGNVEELTTAYEKLIHAQNREVLSNATKIEDNFKNTVEDADNKGVWARLLPFGKTGSEMNTETIEFLEKVYNGEIDKKEEIEESFGNAFSSIFQSEARLNLKTEEALKEAGVLDKGMSYDASEVADALFNLKNENPEKIKGIIEDYYAQFNEVVEQQRTIAQAKLSEAFDIGNAISGLNYGNISEDLQGVAKQVVNSFDWKFLSNLSKDGISVEDWTTEMLDQLNAISKADNAKIETAFDLQTQFNGGEISYGEYVKNLQDVQTTIDGLNLKDEAKEQLEISLGLDDDGVIDQYNALVKRLTDSKNYDFDISENEAKKLLDGLSAEELAIAVDVITEMSNNDVKETADEIKTAIERELASQGLTLDLNLQVEKTKLEALTTAITQSFSGAGLSIEGEGENLVDSIAVIEGMFENLEGYDPSKLFERTANGIRLNSDEFRRLNSEYRNTNIEKINKEMDSLGDIYNQTREELSNLTYGTDEYNTKSAELSAIEERIRATETLAAQYEGLASAYNTWQMAESAGSQRDMYESMLEGLENVDDEISRGWLDDGTIEFLRLIKGDTLSATATTKELKEAYKSLDDTIKHTTYSVRDFFTVDKDGNSTNTGVYNFLDAIGQMEEEKFGGKDVVKRDKKGNIIGFDFQIVGGDKAIAEALGISEELVQIMVRAADDAGFVVSMDGTYQQLDILKEKAQEAANKLKEIGATKFQFDLDTGDEGSVLEQYGEALKIWDTFKKNKNADGTVNMDVKGAKEAYTLVSTLQSMVDKLGEPVYMKLDATQVEKDMKTPLSKLQEYERLVQQENQLKLKGTDTSEIDKAQEKIIDYFEKLSPEVKAELGIKDLSREELQKKIEAGEIEIPATIDLQVEMNNSLRDMVNIALYNAGLIDGEELEKRVDVSLYAGEVDTSDVDTEIDRVVDESDLEADKKVTIKAFAEVFGVENVDDLAKKLESLTDEQIQVLATVLGKVDVDKLKTAVDGLDDKTVQAIAEALGKGDVDGLQTAIKNIPDKKVAQAIAQAFGYEDVDSLCGAIDQLDPKTVQAIAQALGITDVDSLRGAINRLTNKNVKAVAETKGEDKVNSLKSSIDNLKGKTITIWAQIKKKASELWNKLTGGGGVDGTAHVNGTAYAKGTVVNSGRAFKQGDWGTKDSGIALGGEEAPELLVRNGKWHLIGEKGAEFFGYRKGDIIFNASQTKEIFEKGKITHGNGRGKALVSGTAFAGGSTGSGGVGKVNSGKPVGSNSSDEFEETLDWIEIALSRIERVIDRLDKKANNTYKSWSERNKALTNEISKVRDEIELQEDAYNRYIQEANSVGLSSSWAKRVRDGSIDISTVTDEDLAEKIKDYQEWYEKALDCQDAIDDLKEKEAELYKQRFDNVSTQYEGTLGVIEHEKNMLDEYIAQSEAQGHLVSANYYNALMSNERKNNAELIKQRDEMLDKLEEGMKSGTITKGSEAWYEMVNAVDETTLAIEQSNTALLEYEQTLQQLSWETFDILQEKISNVTEEADFLIDLISNDKLYDDNGKLTDEGMSTMGLHGQNYNVYMAQADQYAKEAARLNTEIAKDPYDQDLINRRDEMLELQRESILAAENEKQAIVDMVEEGINLELEALQERIDKYNEALDSQKELYDYQKKVKEQTEEIASLEKQMSAYAGDNSEEVKAKIQELKVSLEEAKADLEETEYDKYISDQKQLLDELYLEYETVLNQRLDNTDALIADMITEVNTSASTISSTISTEASNVGYTLSDSMQTIWDTNSTKINNVITTYGERFSVAQTTTNTALNAINLNMQNVITQLNAIAKTNVKSASTSSASNSKEANAAPTSKPATTTSTTTPTKTISVGGKINAGSAQIYDYAGDKSGERQLYRNDPIYKVLKTDGSWLQVRWHKLSSGITGWFKKGDVKAYATGKQNFSEDEIAWTQEKGREFIVRPSDGAILTPVAEGDSILNANASNNIWDMANSPAEFIKDNLNLGTANVPNNSNVQNAYTQHLDKVVFNLPNVKNYEQLLSEMQKDRNFEKLILSMTIDRLAGKSSLAKGKSIR